MIGVSFSTVNPPLLQYHIREVWLGLVQQGPQNLLSLPVPVRVPVPVQVPVPVPSTDYSSQLRFSLGYDNYRSQFKQDTSLQHSSKLISSPH